MASPRLLTIKGVARLTGYAVGTARHLASRGIFPPPVATKPAKGGRGKPAHLWRVRDIADWDRTFGRKRTRAEAKRQRNGRR